MSCLQLLNSGAPRPPFICSPLFCLSLFVALQVTQAAGQWLGYSFLAAASLLPSLQYLCPLLSPATSGTQPQPPARIRPALQHTMCPSVSSPCFCFPLLRVCVCSVCLPLFIGHVLLPSLSPHCSFSRQLSPTPFALLGAPRVTALQFTVWSGRLLAGGKG
jgi:hypothetical protein